jgi:hypothetical protein
MAAGSSEVVVKFLADTDQLNKGVSGIGKSIGGLSTGLKVLGGAVAGAFAVDQVMDFVGAAEDAQVASKRLANLLKNAGDETGAWAASAEDLASTLQETTGIDDEVIKGAQGILATFHGVSGGVGQMSGAFKRATKAAADMSKAGFGDMSSNAVQLGKALEDPIKGVTALAKSGITFSEDQKKMIKAMVDTGDKAGAMNVILENVESQVGGTAEATVTASDKMSVAWGETQEAIGNLLLPAFERIGPAIQVAAAWFQETMIPAIRDFVASLQERLGPAMSTIVDWFQVSLIPAIQNVIAWIRDHLIPQFGELATWVVEHKDDIAGYFTPFTDAIPGILENVKTIGEKFIEFGKFIVDHVQPPLSTLGDLMNKHKDEIMPALATAITLVMIPAYVGMAGAIWGAIAALAAFAAMAAGIIFIVSLIGAAIVIAGELLGGWGDTWDNIIDKLGMFVDAIKDVIDWVKKAIKWVLDLIDVMASVSPFGGGLPGLPGFPSIPGFGAGGIVTRPTLAMIGEAGPEAVVPLRQSGAMPGLGTVNIYVATTGLGASSPQIQSAVATALRNYTSRNGPI